MSNTENEMQFLMESFNTLLSDNLYKTGCTMQALIKIMEPKQVAMPATIFIMGNFKKLLKEVFIVDLYKMLHKENRLISL